MKRIEGKVALVTGGSRGIGAAIACRLAEEGASVALTFNGSPEKASQVVQAIEKLGSRAIAIQADSADAGALISAIDRTVNDLGGLDILVNNAGVLAVGPIDSFALEDFDRTIAVNVRAVFVATQAAVKHMKEGGRIIERMPFAGGAVYAMSKSALLGLVQGLSRDLGGRGITINNVQPGPVDTDMNPANSETAEMLKKLMALPRYGTVEEIAAMVAYLASPEAGYVTGASLTIDGGFTA
jgi:3-oxoacyl-[acyl-carrier protein] reductase